MGVSDDDVEKIQAAGISDTGQYKLAGNSIVVNAMRFLRNISLEEDLLG